jgi:protocatechuate 3,4-dioxygenase beta subunit
MRFLAALAAMALALPAAAVEVWVTFAPHDALFSGEQAELRLNYLRRLSDVDSDHPTRVDCVSLHDPLKVDLKAGTWSIEARADGWWSRKQFFAINESAARLTIDLWRSGTMAGRIEMSDGSAVPATVTCRFAPSGDDDRAPDGEVVCPVDGGAFRCTVPAIVLDARVRSEHCIADYKTNVDVKPFATTDAGTIHLARGASLTGRVEIAAGVSTRYDRIHVYATPARLDPAADRPRFAAQVARVNDRGAFHFDGLPPGEYEIVASAERLSSATVHVTVLATAFAELQHPLRIDAPQTITIALDPPLDAQRKPWHVEITRSINAQVYQPVASGTVPSNGVWTSAPLHANHYAISIAPDGGGSWKRESVDLGDRPIRLDFKLPSRDINGTVTLGGKPIAAELSLTPDDTAIDVTLASDAEGKFSGAAPAIEEKQWTIVVDVEEPRIKRAFHVPAEELGRLKLDIPTNMLTGSVVDREGKAVSPATVNIWAGNDGDLALTQAPVAKDGSFMFVGLSPGTYRVDATAFLRRSAAQRIELGGDWEIRLVMDDEQKVVGRVVSDFGPVAGATVMLFPTDVPMPGIPFNETNAAGEFTTALPAGAREIDVAAAAPGFDFRIVHTRLLDGMMLNIKVDQRGGTLTIPVPRGSTHPFLVHSGAVVPAEIAASQTPSQQQTSAEGEHHLVLNAMEPGVYAICSLRPDEVPAFRAGAIDHNARCSTGFLAPFSTLSF